jgi:HK97 family phage major capsid protein
MNMTPEIKAHLESFEKNIEQGRQEAIEKIEAVGKDAGEAKDLVAKMAEDLAKQDEKIEEEIKKIKSALTRGDNLSPEEAEAKQIKQEAAAIREWMKANSGDGVTGSVNLNQLMEAKELLRKDLSVGNGPEAGLAVMPQMESMITATVTERSSFRQNATVITISNSDHIDRLVNKKGGVGATRDGETESDANEDTGNPSLGDQKIFANFMGASVNVTQQLLDDASFSIASWIQEEATDDFLTREDTEWFIGRGAGRNVNEARGILTYDAGTDYGQIEQVVSGSSGAFTTDGLLDLQGSLKFQYRSGARFYAQRSVIYSNLLTLKDAEDRHYLVPDFADGFGFRLLGDPIDAAPAMPSAAADSLSLAYGNFNRGYTIVDRSGLVLLRDPYTAYPKVKFRFRKRTGGDVGVFEAIKIQKLATS